MSTHAVPKNLSKSKSEYHNLPVRYIIVVLFTVVFIAISLAVVMIIQNVVIRAISLTAALSIGYLFITMTKTPTILNKTWLEILFFIRELQGKTEYYHFSDTDTKIFEIFDIKKIYDNGLIEFTDSVFGCLMAYDPERVSDDGLEGHISRMQYVLDSLHDDMILKAYVVNSVDRDKKSLMQYVNEIMISQNTAKLQNEHLKSIYIQEKEKQDIETSWKFLLFLSIGKRNDFQDAMIAFNRYFEGFKSKFQGLDVRLARFENATAIKRVYRDLIT